MKHMLRIVIPVLAGLALAGGVAYATIPDGQGVIHACYDKQSGQVRIFDPAGGVIKSCSSKETEIKWNQSGPPGPAGAAGPKGDTGSRV